jgi:hypothetical protein
MLFAGVGLVVMFCLQVAPSVSRGFGPCHFTALLVYT